MREGLPVSLTVPVTLPVPVSVWCVGDADWEGVDDSGGVGNAVRDGDGLEVPV